MTADRWVVAYLLACIALPAAAAGHAGANNILGVEKAPMGDSFPADRPGFGDNIGVIPKGHFELEGGYQYDDNAAGGSTSTLPSGLLFRTGLTDNIEFRLGFDGYQINAPGDDGAANTSVGFKVHVHDESRYTPEIAVLPTVSLPTGNENGVVDQAEPELHLIWSKSLTDKISLGGNVNFAERLNDVGNRKLETAASIAGGYQFSDRLNGYVEYYGIFPEIHNSDNSHVVDGGLAYLATHRTQLDAFLGGGLNDTASSVYAGVGIAHIW